MALLTSTLKLIAGYPITNDRIQHRKSVGVRGTCRDIKRYIVHVSCDGKRSSTRIRDCNVHGMPFFVFQAIVTADRLNL
jgi:hypothetical protein